MTKKKTIKEKKKWPPNQKHKKQRRTKQEALPHTPRRLNKLFFFSSEMLQEIVQQLRSKKDKIIKKQPYVMDPKGRTPSFRRLTHFSFVHF